MHRPHTFTAEVGVATPDTALGITVDRPSPAGGACEVFT